MGWNNPAHRGKKYDFSLEIVYFTYYFNNHFYNYSMGKIKMETKILVFYAGVNIWDVLTFDTEEEADRFINKIKDRMDIDQISKTIEWKFERRNKEHE